MWCKMWFIFRLIVLLLITANRVPSPTPPNRVPTPTLPWCNKSKMAFMVTRQEAQRFSNVTYLLDHPDKCRGQDVHLLLSIKSAPGHADRRKAIRSTWGNESYIQRSKGVTVKVLFALGAPSTEGLQEDLEREDRLHGDLIQQDFADTFRNLTLKLVMQLRWARQRCAHAHFFMSADDDTLVHTPNLVDHLQDAARRNVTDLWLGHVWSGTTPERDEKIKYSLSTEMYPWSTFPEYTAGPGYVLSRDAVEKVYRATLTLNASIHLEDVFMGICGDVAGLRPQNHDFFTMGYKAPYHPCIYRQMMNSHGHHGQDMYNLWKAATDPRVELLASETNCTLVKMDLLCKPQYDVAYPCKAASQEKVIKLN